MTRQQKIAAFDPNGPSLHDSLFGLPFNYKESEVIVLPVPWEVTVSYGSGTARGPEAIREASAQVDLYDPARPEGWQRGIYFLPINDELRLQSARYRKAAEKHIRALESGEAGQHLPDEVNRACREMVDWVKAECSRILQDQKKLILLGGDHSTPLGYIQALAEIHNSFGILQIDAHADLREAYEGFTYSHASIMHNALELKEISHLVQVGIRDYCEAEARRIAEDGRIQCFFDRDLKYGQFRGETWQQQVERVVETLPEKLYLSFDIDGLDPKLCPHTGTPVPGGFQLEEVLFLLEQVVQSGRQIIGMDLNEVSPGPDEWDASVGARLLYRLCNLL